MEVADGETRIRIERGTGQPSRQEPGALPTPAAPGPATGTGPDAALPVDFNRLIEVKSPLVGVFYSAPSPDSETFVSIGSQVKKGDVLCIIETMKLMNDITAEHDGEIVDICIKNGDIAEYGQVLFKMY